LRFDLVEIVATITGLIGLWTLVTGRPLLGVQHYWPIGGRSLRMVGALTVGESLLVVIVAATYGAGTAFVIFAVGSLFVAVIVELRRRQQANT
jgi:hypothetical protein